MGTFLRHEPCPSCGSSDALARYDDGSAHCFACEHYERSSDEPQQPNQRRQMNTDFIHGDCVAISNRGLTQETCAKFGYEVSTEHRCHIANYRDVTGALVGQKIRREGKEFAWVGAGKNPPLYGQWLWGKGKHLVITEGEIDALSVSQAMNNKWPVVSLPSGAQHAAKVLQAHYEYLDQFERIVLMFDQDEPGRKATEEAAAVLPMGKVAVAYLEHKDANEVLIKQGPAALTTAFWNAKPWRPDGIVSGEEFTVERLHQAAAQGFSLPFPQLQSMMLGLRKGELTLFTAGSGVGKTTAVRQLAYHLHQQHGCTIGNVYLEENNDKTAQGYVALHNRVPLGRLRFDPGVIGAQQWESAVRDVVQQRMYFYNHFGSLESGNLLGRLRYLASVCRCDFIVLDHVSIVTSGLESSQEGERKDIDRLMTQLQSLVQETGVGILAVVHLKRASGKNFNEGSQVSLIDLRGSAGLEQLSDNVIALERDQQSEGEQLITLRILKCRELGEVGPADSIIYNRQTGWLETAAAQGL